MVIALVLALLAVPTDNYLSMTNASGSFQLGWSHIHRDAHEVLFEEYTCYTDGKVINTAHHFVYNDIGVLQSADCWTNYPQTQVVSRYEPAGLVLDVTVRGETRTEHIPPFTLADEMALNLWAGSAKEGDTLSFKEIDCMAPNVHRCRAVAEKVETVSAGALSQSGRKVVVTCDDLGSRRAMWFDAQGGEVATKEDGIVCMHVD